MASEEMNEIMEAKAAERQEALFKAYYNSETNEPIKMDSLVKRIKKRFNEIDKTSAGVMLDLFFLHQNWNSFYQREDSFSKYLREDLCISRTHAYGIINSVKFLISYFSHKGNAAPNMENFIGEITQSIDTLGIRKLISLSNIKDEGKKFSLFAKVLDGVEIEDVELQTKPAAKKTKTTVAIITVENNQLMFENKPILVFPEELDGKIKDYIVKSVSRFLQKK